MLHRMALQALPVAEMSFDIDQRLVKADPQSITDARHVFVSGLARAGTTVLMRRLHASGAFRSLTYRDMPFVLAPNLWRRMSGGGRKMARAERAHGDGIYVDADSPESLDEVFWRVHSGADYLFADHLAPHRPDAAAQTKFRAYVNAVLAAGDPPQTRYLSKNNNNILRLGALHEIFPNALLLLPFRAPLDHARSLQRQHERFVAMQAEDPFVARYMTWLAHHEFGGDHRPFRFAGAPDTAASPTEDGLAYWLTRWCEAYEWVERAAPAGAVFVCYETLCDDPQVWRAIAEQAEIAPEAGAEEPFRLAARTEADAEVPADLAARAQEIYRRLRRRAVGAAPTA